jgi:hypothetical protein
MGAAWSPITEQHRWRIGEDRTFRYKVENPNTGLVPDDIDWSYQWVLRQEREDATAIITKTSASASQIEVVHDVPDPTWDEPGPAPLIDAVDVHIPRADSLALAPGVYFYTLARTDPGFFRDLAEGDAIIRYAATR